jgi:hypothetical protein
MLTELAVLAGRFERLSTRIRDPRVELAVEELCEATRTLLAELAEPRPTRGPARTVDWVSAQSGVVQIRRR